MWTNERRRRPRGVEGDQKIGALVMKWQDQEAVLLTKKQPAAHQVIVSIGKEAAGGLTGQWTSARSTSRWLMAGIFSSNSVGQLTVVVYALV